MGIETMSDMDSTQLLQHNSADDLELQGATLIILGVFAEGLKCWEESIACRSHPRRIVPEENLPPLLRQCAGPQWTDQHDIARLLKESDNIDGKLNIICQAMLVRLAHGFGFNNLPEYASAYQRLILTCSNWDDSYTATLMLGFALFEWDNLYGSAPTLLDDKCVRQLLSFITCYFTTATEDTLHLYTFGNAMIVLEWMTTASEKFVRHFSKPNLSSGYPTNTVRVLLDVLCGMPLDDVQLVEVKNYLFRIIAVDLRSSSGRDVLQDACASSSRNTSQLVRMLVESGANLNSTDDYGDTCLHHLLGTNRMCSVDSSIIQFLLDSGADPNVANKDGFTAIDIFKRGKQHVVGKVAFPLSSLQRMSANALKRDRRILRLVHLPKAVVKLVESA